MQLILKKNEFFLYMLPIDFKGFIRVYQKKCLVNNEVKFSISKKRIKYVFLIKKSILAKSM